MGEREKQEAKKKETITGKKPSIDHHHALHHLEESEAMLLLTGHNRIFGHEDTPHAP
jgi:hypothetical protein